MHLFNLIRDGFVHKSFYTLKQALLGCQDFEYIHEVRGNTLINIYEVSDPKNWKNIRSSEIVENYCVHKAAMQGLLNLVKYFGDMDSSLLDTPDFGDFTPLYYACGRNKTEVVEYLVSKGAVVDEYCFDHATDPDLKNL